MPSAATAHQAWRQPGGRAGPGRAAGSQPPPLCVCVLLQVRSQVQLLSLMWWFLP